MGTLELVQRAARHGEAVAIVDADGAHTYAQLLRRSAAVAGALLADCRDLDEARVAFLLSPGFDHVAVQWGIWRAGGIAVPLALSHPVRELASVLEDAEPRHLIAEAGLRARLQAAAGATESEVLVPDDLQGASRAADRVTGLGEQRRALMIYTSGTTGRPKGVVSSHAHITAQIRALVQAWEWTAADRILHVLPLHHVHGVINVLSCALWSGAICEFLTPFDAERVWERLASGEISVFMAVPTVYRRLIAAWEEAPDATRVRWSAAIRGLRLMVSGSAALPIATLERWEKITDHRLLERYGMTEIGMGFGNPLHGERRPGTVGQPFPGVEARIVDDAGTEVPEGSAGQIEIRGPQVFSEYWRRPEETAASFRDGWFVTGDEGAVHDGYWCILGRRSVDIIKTGGYKVSALEIEEVLRGHEAIAELAVVGVADADWGECVCGVLVLEAGATLDLVALRSWCKERLAPYKAPRHVVILTELPRNAMGKVVKPPLRELFDGMCTAPGT